MKNNGRWKKTVRTLFARKVAAFSAIIVAVFVLMAVFAPLIAPYDPNYADFASFLQGPGKDHILGTDNYGRDVLSRIIYGTRVSLIIGVFAVMIACIAGTFFGMVAGYFGGIVDDVITRIMEAIRAIPQIILAMALTAVFGSGIRNLAIILGISSMAGYVRMMRGQVLTIKQADYIMAGKLQGNKNFRLMLKHILPNSISPIIVMMTQQVGQTILAEAGLSFLGLGISAPTASWGGMVSDGRLFLLQNPVFALTPGVCVAVLVICLNMFGDGVRDALDPRLRGEV
ncbi:ABC transporter permease [Lacrimispora celerecrescens]|uniref:Peptide/nickel transport system permease protein n=1 Tax=[Clostridium] celerecrescens 18A TaxID=1286362 RepID=A0A2M8Z565_9FIRM|nr:ABC transporter permease [Lacrimispora celerecrescens]PJJ28598.1 peptide/nickel transport system permease protein [[Clostridium] celerecrescens 18A]